MSKNKIDEIELQETTDNNSIRLTKEENRKIIPREVANLQFILNNFTQLSKYCWEVDGQRVKLLFYFFFNIQYYLLFIIIRLYQR